MAQIITIAIVDDHHIFRTGLRQILDGISNFKVVADAESGHQIMDFLRNGEVDIIFMDIELQGENGIAITKEIKSKYPTTSIIALTMFGDIEYFNQMVKAGADGFLLKKASPDELKAAIRAVAEGTFYTSNEFAHLFQKQANIPKLNFTLSDREKEVLSLICEGYSTSEIAEKLFLSTYTVEGHRQNLIKKTGAKNAAHLVKFAITNNILEE